MPQAGRRFLFLQGPHGPFFHMLGRMLRRAGCAVWRVGFNAGDRAFWFRAPGYIPYQGRPEDWPEALEVLLGDLGITDVVLYGDTRPVHAAAVARARARGITVHVFEEGYLRPYWVTYERGGANGNSRLMAMTLPEMRAALDGADPEQPDTPVRWGDMAEHMFYGALYHACLLFGNPGYRNFRSHRQASVTREFALHLRRLLTLPMHALERWAGTQRILLSGHPFHLALLQLDHDESFRRHGPFATTAEFAAEVIAGFARGAPAHHHLVFKAHPLDDGRTPLRAVLRRLAQEHGLGGRVHFVPGGKLAQLLSHARSAVTVTSTAAQQALWRGIPVRVFGAAVYAQPELATTQPLAEFFAAPRRPDLAAYRTFRRYLLETSQVPGGFYAARGRRALMRQVVDMMLDTADPYDALAQGTAAPRQQLRLVT